MENRRIILECQTCEEQFQIDSAELDVQQDGADPRQMGDEIFYRGALVSQCPECDTEFELEYEGSEYPVGIPNYSEYSGRGVTVIKAAQLIEFVYSGASSYDDSDADETAANSSLILPGVQLISAQLNDGIAELIEEIRRRQSALHEISPRQFEELIAQIFRNNNFSVELTQKTRDGGRDIVAIKSDLGIKSKFLIECKKYAPDRKVGVALVRNLYGVQMSEGANKALIATTSDFTADARRFVQQKNTTEWMLDLKAYTDVMKWIKGEF